MKVTLSRQSANAHKPLLLVGLSVGAGFLSRVGFGVPVAAWGLLAGTAVAGVLLSNALNRIPLFAIALYLCIGALPFSTYRGVLTAETILEYVAIVGAIQAAIGIAELVMRQPGRGAFAPLPWTQRHAVAVWALTAISYAALAKVTLQHGIVFLNQFERFDISSYDSYFVKAGGYAVLYIAASKGMAKGLRILPLLLFPVLPTLLIGSRSGVVILYMGVAAIVIARAMAGDRQFAFNPSKVRWSALALALVGYGVIVAGFVLRRGQGGDYMTVPELHDAFFSTPRVVSYLIMPVHMGLRETIGLSNLIIERGMTNDVLGCPLIVADFLTLLPGHQMSAGVALGTTVGSVAAGGLTPGMLGGLRLDMSLAGACVVAFLLALWLACLSARARINGTWCAFWALTLIQFLQLFHRGFAKPEYVFAYFILATLCIAPRLTIRR